jgi:hypothetical protein
MEAQIYEFEVEALDGFVDSQAGIIEGVSVITGGVSAKGHNLEVDDVTLKQMHKLASKKGKVPVKWNHKSGADAVNGFFTNFRIDGNKLKADWHLLKTHSQYNQALELAERMPENVGFSASFMGLSELADGTKVYNPDEKTRHHYLLVGGARLPVPATEKIFARCQDLISVDLVASPAANPDGMFEAGVDTGGNDMAETTKPGNQPEEKTVDFEAFLKAQLEFNQGVAAFMNRFAENDDEDEEEEEEEEEAPAASEFNSINEVLQYFETRLDAAASAQEKQEFEAAQHALGEKIDSLLEVNEELVSENQILAEAFKELSAKTKSTVEFTAGTDGNRKATVTPTGGRKLTEFEVRVAALKAEGKDAAEALTFAVGEDTDRYQQHLEAKGVFAQQL